MSRRNRRRNSRNRRRQVGPAPSTASITNNAHPHIHAASIIALCHRPICHWRLSLLKCISFTLNSSRSGDFQLQIHMTSNVASKPSTLSELRASGWVSKTVKQEIHDNFLRMLAAGDELFPGIVGYDDTVVPEINIALLAGHDMLFLGEK